VREILRAVLRKKCIIALLEADATDKNGGHTEDECRMILRSPEYADRLKDMEGQVAEWAEAWGQPDLRLPTAKEVEDALFATTPMVWYRLADLKDVSLRMIAEWLLHAAGSSAEQRACHRARSGSTLLGGMAARGLNRSLASTCPRPPQEFKHDPSLGGGRSYSTPYT
jgi:hypothetical protein